MNYISRVLLLPGMKPLAHAQSPATLYLCSFEELTSCYCPAVHRDRARKLDINHVRCIAVDDVVDTVTFEVRGDVTVVTLLPLELVPRMIA